MHIRYPVFTIFIASILSVGCATQAPSEHSSIGTNRTKTNTPVAQVNELLAQAQSQLDARRYVAAENTFKEILNIATSNAEAYTGLGDLYYLQQRFQEASQMYLYARNINPQSSESITKLGSAYMRMRRHDEAKGLFLTAIKLHPDNGLAHIRLGNLYEIEGDNLKAIGAYTDALVIEPNNYMAKSCILLLHTRLATLPNSPLKRLVHYLDEEHQQVNEDFLALQKEYTNAPTSEKAPILKIYGKHLLDTGRYPVAFLELRNALKNPATHDVAQTMMKQLRDFVNQPVWDGGNTEHQRSKIEYFHLQDDPFDLEAWLTLARLYYFSKEYISSGIAFARSVELTQHKNPSLLVDQADAIAMSVNKRMKGLPEQLVKQALAIDPTHKKGLWLAATASYQERDYEQTLKYWEQLKELFANEDKKNYAQMLRNIIDIKKLLGKSTKEEQEELAAISRILYNSPPSSASNYDRKKFQAIQKRLESERDKQQQRENPLDYQPAFEATDNTSDTDTNTDYLFGDQ